RVAAQRPGQQRAVQNAADQVVLTPAADELRAARAVGRDTVGIVEPDADTNVLGVDPFEKQLDQLKADRVIATQVLRRLQDKLSGLKAEVADTEIAVRNAWRRLDRIEDELGRRERMR
ncbi:MAG: hypothetical protein H0T89_02155, partial [Deltaproteobacteria bacterium]|nr:hypothetical protein [Deltaproteobacteria bacterium]